MWDIETTGNGGTDIIRLETTVTILATKVILARNQDKVYLRVWVGFFGVNTAILDNVGEALVHETAVAAHVALGLGAVDQVLLGK